MKRILSILLAAAVSAGAASAEEITLYDSAGEAIPSISGAASRLHTSLRKAASLTSTASTAAISAGLKKGLCGIMRGSWRASPKALSICTRGRSTTGRRRCRSPSGRSRSSRRKGLSTGTLFQVRLLLSSSCRAGINSRLQRAHPVPSRFVLPSTGQAPTPQSRRPLREEGGKFPQVFPFPPLAV